LAIQSIWHPQNSYTKVQVKGITVKAKILTYQDQISIQLLPTV
jgi:hypothetical protein